MERVYKYKHKIKDKIVDEIINNSAIVVNTDTGEIYTDFQDKKADKIIINIPFMKFNLSYRDILKSKLSKYDYLYFLELANTINKYGVIDVDILKEFISENNLYSKLRTYKNLGLIKKIELKGFKKKLYFINPYICHKSKHVWRELSEHFKPLI